MRVVIGRRISLGVVVVVAGGAVRLGYLVIIVRRWHLSRATILLLFLLRLLLLRRLLIGRISRPESDEKKRSEKREIESKRERLIGVIGPASLTFGWRA